MNKSMITTRNPMYRLIASPLFVIIFSTLTFVFLIIASIVDTSIPDMIATEAQRNSWILEHGEPGDQTDYYISMTAALFCAAFAITAYIGRKSVLSTKYWL